MNSNLKDFLLYNFFLIYRVGYSAEKSSVCEKKI